MNRLEEMVAEATGSRRAVATSAGTTGLHAALTAVGVKPGDLVIIPSFTFIATANAVAHCGAIPWMMDVSAKDWCLDPVVVRAELERGTERRVAAIMPVYALGNIPNMDEFRTIADEFSIPLVVDAACAIGATYWRQDSETDVIVNFAGVDKEMNRCYTEINFSEVNLSILYGEGWTP